MKKMHGKDGWRVLVCCANGMASGQILIMSLEKAFKDLGIKVECINHCMLSEVEAYEDSCNMIVCSVHFVHTLSYIQEKGIPVIGIQNLMSLQEVEEKISNILKEDFT